MPRQWLRWIALLLLSGAAALVWVVVRTAGLVWGVVLGGVLATVVAWFGLAFILSGSPSEDSVAHLHESSLRDLDRRP